MKKLTTIFLAAALVFAVAGQASATALETSGEFRARFWYLKNYVANEKSTEFWDQRLRLNLDWPIAEGVKLHARADLMEGLWGDNVLTETTPAAVAGQPVPAKTYAASPNSRPAVAWDQINLMFVVPSTPLTVTVGRQLAHWGAGVFVSQDNRDRFKVTAKFGDVTALYTYDKYTEIFALHDQASLDDRRQHSVGAIGKVAGFNLGLIYGMILDNTNPAVDVTLNAVDAYAMGKVGPADLKAEVAYAFGKNDLTGGTDVDLTGLIAYLGASVPAGPVTVGAEFGYAAGDKTSSTTKNEAALKHDYQSPFWSVILFNNFDYDGFAGESRSGATDTGLANAMAGKLSVTAAPVKGLTIYGAAVYATRDQVAKGADKPMGTEIDLVATYAITETVNLTVGGGYLMAGDFYNNGPKDIENPWGAVCAFTTKF